MNNKLVQNIPVLMVISSLAGCAMDVKPCARVEAPSKSETASGATNTSKVRKQFSIDYKLSHADTVVIAGESEIDDFGTSKVEETSHDTSARLFLNAHEEGGRVIVSVDYREHADGREIAWSPTVAIAPGAIGSATLALGPSSEARKITIALRSPTASATMPAREVVMSAP